MAAETPRAVTTLNVKVSPLELRLNSFILNDLQHFIERIQTSYLLRDLKQYRPHRRPITEIPEEIPSIKFGTLSRKRKLIVRDWFFFVVWYNRLRRIIKDFYSKDNSNAYLLFDPKYSYLIEQVLNKEISLDDLVQHIQQISISKAE